jgi:hypothetical protein
MGGNRRSTRPSRPMVVAFVTALLAGIAITAPVAAAGPRAPRATLYVVAASDSGGLGASGPVLRFGVRGAHHPPTLERTIDDPSFFRPCCLAFTRSGDMLVVNRGDPFVAHSGYISRILRPQGTPISDGAIALPDFDTPHWAAFRNGDLFVAQLSDSSVLRLQFNRRSIASPAGLITDGLCCNAPRGVAFSSNGELFVSECCGVDSIARFRFDNAGIAIPNGVISGNGLDNPQDLAFSDSGELFIANADANTISRFTFDSSGVAAANGTITGAALSGPAGLDFSPWGELFVGNAFAPGGISRWTFTRSGAAVFNGSFATPSNVVIDLQFGPQQKHQ